ncbi:MAG: ARMT1-like domain-containing protein [Phycisphaerae bacterium]|nr:ARMT1-like domain-containing protein [Phycisphaerae bacterium]MDW8262018.1 ARMT1-like domain-containing protein [Phycisphaerales bacterium]
MSPFVKLADPGSYVACSWDLCRDHEARQYWVPFFKQHLETILKVGCEALRARGVDERNTARRAQACREEFHAVFDRFAADPEGSGPVTILTLDRWRDQILRRHGFVDPFIDLKQRENEAALPLVPQVVAELDQHRGQEQILTMIRGIFAGNIFDMGAAASSRRMLEGDLDFFRTRDRLPARPWLVDDFDRLVESLQRTVHRRAVFFVDNAGSDFMLGVLPMVRWLARRGTTVVLAANERPTLNDMTAAEVRAWWPQILQVERSFAGLPVEIVSTGTGEPLIDLSAVSPELNEAASEADLVILEGMGRGIESNLDARFTCEALNIGMIKDSMIARRNGGNLYDVVLKFR